MRVQPHKRRRCPYGRGGCPQCTPLPDPEPPQGVRLVRANGAVVPLEVVHVGREDREGITCDVWDAVLTVRYEPGDAIKVDAIPPRCSVRLRLDVPP